MRFFVVLMLVVVLLALLLLLLLLDLYGVISHIKHEFDCLKKWKITDVFAVVHLLFDLYYNLVIMKTGNTVLMYALYYCFKKLTTRLISIPVTSLL